MVNLECPYCATNYEVEADVLDGYTRQVKCDHCGNEWYPLPRLSDSREVARIIAERRRLAGKDQVSRTDRPRTTSYITQELERRKQAAQISEDEDKDKDVNSDVSAEELEVETSNREAQEAEVTEQESVESMSTKGVQRAFPNVGESGIPIVLEILRSSPYRLEAAGTRLAIAESSKIDGAKGAPNPRTFMALQKHVEFLLAECEHKQVPTDFRRRLSNYHEALNEEFFDHVLLDGPLAFIAGSLRDEFLTQALDLGFLEGCQHLMNVHAELCIGIAGDLLPEPNTAIDPDEAIEIADSAIEAMEDKSVETEVVNTLVAAREFFEASKLSDTTRSTFIRKGFVVLGGILSTAIAGATGMALYSWASSAGGVAVISKLQPLFDRIVALFT